MVKAYLKYAPLVSFGTIQSSSVPVLPLPQAESPLVACAAADALLVWNLRRGLCVAKFANDATCRAGAVTSIAVSESLLAAGYSDGSVRLWQTPTQSNTTNKNAETEAERQPQPVAAFNAHRTAVSALAFCSFPPKTRSLSTAERTSLQAKLVSGANDGDVTVWDTASSTPLFRLSAHTNAVTQLVFFSHNHTPYILTASKDALVKLHEVNTQHCIQVLPQPAEVWAMLLDQQHGLLLVAGTGAEIQGYTLNKHASKSDEQLSDVQKLELFTAFGSVSRKTAADRVSTLRMTTQANNTFVIVCANDATAEVFRVRSSEEAEGKRRKKAKKAQKKKEENQQSEPNNNRKEANEEQVDLSDFLVSVRQLRMKKKLRSISFLAPNINVIGPRTTDDQLMLLVQQKDNSLEVHSMQLDAVAKRKKRPRNDPDTAVKKDIKKVLSLVAPGHRGEVRAVSASPDGNSMLTVAGDALKLWNVATGSCIRTMQLKENGMCVSFANADGSVALVGCKTGILQAFDLGSGLQLDCKQAHDGDIWSLCLDKQIYEANVVITGGSDKKVNVWNMSDLFDHTEDSEDAGLERVQSLAVADEVMCVKVAHERERPLLLVSMMDSTTRAYFLDNFEPYLSFYGHRLPVTSMDVSSDGLLLITGSVDKTVKIWGMDFGDCRKSLRAHSDSVLSLCFQPKTHYFFSGSRDGVLKYWDADKFEMVTTLPGQRGTVYCIATDDDGEVVMSGSQDRSVRVWLKTDEPLFLEEERDRRQDEMFENTLIEEDLREAQKRKAAERDGLSTEDFDENQVAGKRSIESVKGGERILEALKLCREERIRVAEGSEESRSPLLLGLSPERYMLRTLESVKSSDIEQTLDMLPLHSAVELMEYCRDMGDICQQHASLSAEMLAKVVLFLVKSHHSQICAGAMGRKALRDVHLLVQEWVKMGQRRAGMSQAALELWQGELELRDDRAFRDAAARAYNVLKNKRQK